MTEAEIFKAIESYYGNGILMAFDDLIESEKEMNNTYSTYQEAKIANPESEIYYDDFHKCFQSIAHKGCSFGNLTKCNPSDYCITVEKFLADGHKFVMGDIVLNSNGKVDNVGIVAPVDSFNTPDEMVDSNIHILRAAALDVMAQNKEAAEVKAVGEYEISVINSFVEHCMLKESKKIDEYLWDLNDVRSEIKVYADQQPKPKHTKEEYVKVDKKTSIFSLGDKLRTGLLFNADKRAVASESYLMECLTSDLLYELVVTELTEREAFIEAACSINELYHGDRRQYIVESLFDSGKFKLVD